MESTIQKIESKYRKKKVIALRSGDTVRVHQKIVESGKERVQIFEGVVIKVSRSNSLSSSFTVRRIASGIGVEKTFLIHSPGILRIEVTKRSKVRRNYLSYMRGLRGKGSRLSGVDFDKKALNEVDDEAAEAEEAQIHEKKVEDYDPDASKAEKTAEKSEIDEVKSKAPESNAYNIGQNPKEKPEAKTPAEPESKEK